LILRRDRQPANEKKILDIPHFEAKVGDKICVVGRNGNGKTTFLKALAGIYPVTSGSIWTCAKPTAVLAAGIGLEDELSVFENINLALILKSISPRKSIEIRNEIIRFCELEDDQYKQYKHLSTGFKSRLAFAIAVSEKPHILVLDEVLGGGDEFFMKKANAKLQETIDHAETAFIATHGPDEFKDICNRLLLIEKGTIIFDGNFSEGLDLYRSKHG
jgi:ABC-2 type transport system ATP-binding protein/lipopolysaccharide transport system ATP-binding protein